jgi:hypothetical protein
MTDQLAIARIVQMVESVAQVRGYQFSPQRLAAVVPEVQRMRELVEWLRALPIDEEGPAIRVEPL